MPVCTFADPYGELRRYTYNRLNACMHACMCTCGCNIAIDEKRRVARRPTAPHTHVSLTRGAVACRRHWEREGWCRGIIAHSVKRKGGAGCAYHIIYDLDSTTVRPSWELSVTLSTSQVTPHTSFAAFAGFAGSAVFAFSRRFCFECLWLREDIALPAINCA